MPLNKLDNFIKNTEGRILYVSPSDLDSTDTIDNQGNSLARPFKTLQRALIEAARFSYVKGNSNDIIERTTILLMPGEHEIDNRPGLAIYKFNETTAYVRKKTATGGTAATETLNLDLNSVFDLTQEDNILYKFNSVDGGVVVPRGTSIVGLDLRKTKLRPKYVPNPTDPAVGSSSIFKVTGSCYFWQFSIFDGNDLDLVYTDPVNFGSGYKAAPTFSHNKLTVFEYCDGVNNVSGYDSTDLDMYYYKLGNAYNQGSTRPIEDAQKYPRSPLAFEPQVPEYEIVGAFKSDPLKLTKIQAGSDSGVTPVVTVTTVLDHNLQVGVPIKIRGVTPTSYNISAVVTWVSPTDPKVFTYTLPNPDPVLPAGNISSANVTVETDTVEGASPYIFNCSMRSVYGMNGLNADGSKATGFRSMVVAQFTGISLQKDDRAFVKYNTNNRTYDSISYATVNGADLSGESSAIASGKVYHLDSGAVYRPGWETSHIKITNDAILQVVSVFAIGYTKHFEAQTGGDASITNSNSNFGQLSLVADGFKKEAFDKDNKAFITSIISPRSIESPEKNVDWLELATAGATSTKLFLYGYTNEDIKPPYFNQGYKIGAKANEKLYVEINDIDYEAEVVIPGESVSSEVSYTVTEIPDANNTNTFVIGTHNLETTEKVVVISDIGDLPENIETNTVYYVIKVDATTIKLASSSSNAENGLAINVSKGSNLKIISRVTDKEPGEKGHPIQFDSGWYITVASSGNTITSQLSTLNAAGTEKSDVSYIKRKEDTRSLDEKVYQLRVVVPKESANAKNPENGFVIQQTSSTGYDTNDEFTQTTTLTENDYDFKKNLSYISTCNYSGGTVSVRTELPHKLNIGDTIIIKNVTDTTNTTGAIDSGYNGTFNISAVTDDMEFEYETTQTPSAYMTNDVTVRNISLPRFERNNLQNNLYVYRNEVVSEYIRGVQDGIYHLDVLSADNSVSETFNDLKYSQNVRDLYPQMDSDNPDANPQSASSYAVSSPLGKVVTNDLKKSITRETIDTTVKTLGIGIPISNVTAVSAGVCTVTFSQRHGFAGIVTGEVGAGGNNYIDGTYQNVKLYNEAGLDNWWGATARVVVTGNDIDSIDLIAPGSGYASQSLSDPIQLYVDTSVVRKSSGINNAYFVTNKAGISSCLGNVIQFTGSGTATDSYGVIVSGADDNDYKVSIAKTDGDPDITTGQYALPVAPRISINGTPSSSTVSGITTTLFNTDSAHGLVAGNSFRLLDSNNNNLGDYIVKNKTDYDTFTAITTGNTVTTAEYILKHGFSANEKVSDKTNENLAVRANPVFESDTAKLLGLTEVTSGTVTTHYMQVALPTGLNGIIERFPYGSYVQIDDEILRIASPNLTGASADKLAVIRGALATNVSAHETNSLIKKIKPIPIEFRRPSILRASGHTFEYLGYGPGNYSTALPQVQDRTLSEREEFLAQSQEKAGGIVVYTGMNSKGDFYIGNLKKSSATGEETTYDTPVPTITGQDPARLSAVFDEVTVKERIKVEGGPNNLLLSQFDGPVTFNESTRFNSTVDFATSLIVSSEVESTSTSTGAFQVGGGVGIGKSLYTDSLRLADDKKAYFGNDDGDLEIYHDSASDQSTIISNSKKISLMSGIGLEIEDENGKQLADFTKGGASRLFYNANGDATDLKFETTNEGVKVTGIMSATSDIIAYASSDERLKDNVTPIEDPLAKVISISGNTFNWNSASQYEGKGDTGVIAQEIEALDLPGVSTTREDGYKAVRYEKLVPLLIEAIKELSAKVDNLEQKLSDK